MNNLTPNISPKEKRWTTIHYTINIDIPYKEENMQFRIDFNEASYSNKIVNEFEGLSTPYSYVCEEAGMTSKVFKEDMTDYFTHYFNPRRKKDLSQLEENEIKKDVDKIWNIIAEEMDKNKIIIPEFKSD